ncbi:MAG: hypothetical protein MO852_17650 [Candidatus Devosia euplotis]|nr:hypothetical protein [Candidatus Devosia euplotis]
MVDTSPARDSWPYRRPALLLLLSVVLGVAGALIPSLRIPIVLLGAIALGGLVSFVVGLVWAAVVAIRSR